MMRSKSPSPTPVTEYPPRRGSSPSTARVHHRQEEEEDNPWGAMETKMRSVNLKTFTALQSHFYRTLLGGGMEQRKAWDMAQDSMMCFVVANYR